MVDDMSNNEKSVMLAKARGWKPYTHDELGEGWLQPEGQVHWMVVPDFYAVDAMALAWRVLMNWAVVDIGAFTDWLAETVAVQTGLPHFDRITHATRWWFVMAGYIPFDEALDKILALTTEAGRAETGSDKGRE